jgi:hypothetical protein
MTMVFRSACSLPPPPPRPPSRTQPHTAQHTHLGPLPETTKVGTGPPPVRAYVCHARAGRGLCPPTHHHPSPPPRPLLRAPPPSAPSFPALWRGKWRGESGLGEGRRPKAATRPPLAQTTKKAQGRGCAFGHRTPPQPPTPPPQKTTPQSRLRPKTQAIYTTTAPPPPSPTPCLETKRASLCRRRPFAPAICWAAPPPPPPRRQSPPLAIASSLVLGRSHARNTPPCHLCAQCSRRWERRERERERRPPRRLRPRASCARRRPRRPPRVFVSFHPHAPIFF